MELEQVRRLMRLKRRAGASPLLCKVRGLRAARSFLLRHRFDNLVSRWLRAVHRWAGHCARLPLSDPRRVWLRTRCCQWWQTQLDMPPHRRFRHQGQIRLWRWEERVWRIHRDMNHALWIDRALNRDRWKELETRWVAEAIRRLQRCSSPELLIA
eukprot:6491002-Amphidinium_carterae.2